MQQPYLIDCNDMDSFGCVDICCRHVLGALTFVVDMRYSSFCGLIIEPSQETNRVDIEVVAILYKVMVC